MMETRGISEDSPKPRKVKALHGVADQSDDVAGLAVRPEFWLGDLAINPALRTIGGPRAEASLEPKVMQVLLALADADGRVQTRDALLQRCWHGLFVGEDSLTRAIGEIRRALRHVASAAVELETIPKTGYRLVVRAEAAPRREEPAPAGRAEGSPVSRRMMLTGGALVALAAGAGLYRAVRPDPVEQQVAALITAGRDSWRLGLPDREAQGIGFLTEAVTLKPDNAEAWGMLALLKRNVAEVGEPRAATAAVGESEAAARRALALDPTQGDALAARAGLLPIFGDWIGARKRLDSVLRVVPGQVAALSDLGLLEASVGRMRAALAITEKQADADPLAAVHQHKLVYRLWSAGRIAEMDQAADRALNLWPTHAAIWFARLWTYAYTGRAEAALALLADAEARPAMPPPVQTLFTVTMRALQSRRPADVADAIARNVESARRAPGAAVAAVQHLAALGAIDEAFDVARGYLVRQGPVVGQLRHSDERMVRLNEQHRRKTMMLFIPATAPLRADERFLALARDIGLMAYWEKSGQGPDFLMTRLSLRG
jgi:DNA-binding winged helix-turn-helix (wHTH) protein